MNRKETETIYPQIASLFAQFDPAYGFYGLTPREAEHFQAAIAQIWVKSIGQKTEVALTFEDVAQLIEVMPAVTGWFCRVASLSPSRFFERLRNGKIPTSLLGDVAGRLKEFMDEAYI